MRQIVADASVVSKWFIQEEDSDRALKIRELYLQGKITLSSPSLLLYEVGNVFFKHPSLTTQDCEKALEALLKIQINLKNLNQTRLLKDCMQTSKQLDITFYDASYVALTKRLHAEFITADQKLHRKTQETIKVHLLPTLHPQTLT